MIDQKTAPYGVLLLRVALGVMFIAHSAYLKVFVFTLPGTAQFFESLGLPGFSAYGVVAAETLGDQTYMKFPFVDGMRPVVEEGREQVLNRTWRPALAVTGVGGIPPLEDAGNVMRPMTAVVLSLRLPPTCDASAAARRVKELLESDPPYGARVHFDASQHEGLWIANRDLAHHAFVVPELGIDIDLPASKARRADVGNVPPGEYQIICSLPGHENMTGTLVVSG